MPRSATEAPTCCFRFSPPPPSAARPFRQSPIFCRSGGSFFFRTTKQKDLDADCDAGAEIGPVCHITNSVDLAHFYATGFARPARRPMVVVRLPNTEYRGRKGVVKFLGPTADGKLRPGAPPQMCELTSLFQPLSGLSG
jgi:hypothetical protein